MKKITFLLLAIFVTTLNLEAQCTEEAFDFGNNTSIPSYNINGEVNVTLNLDDTVTVNLGSDFSTAAGPDVRIYFLNSNGASDTALMSGVADDFENIQFGLLENFSGAQSYTAAIPEGTNISNFDKVYFFCLEFEQFWDFGTVEPFTENDCEVLNIEDFAQNDFLLFPNPAQGVVNLTQDAGVNRQLQIYNTAGKMVYNQQLQVSTKEETLDISNLNTGIYFVTISNDQFTRTQKLIVM